MAMNTVQESLESIIQLYQQMIVDLQDKAPTAEAARLKRVFQKQVVKLRKQLAACS